MQRGTTTISDALDMFLLDCEARRLTISTRQFYRVKLGVFVRWSGENGVRNLNELTAHHIRQFLVSIQRRGLTSQYQHNLARTIRAFLNYCVHDELVKDSAFAKVQMPKLQRKIPTSLSTAQINAILRQCMVDQFDVLTSGS